VTGTGVYLRIFDLGGRFRTFEGVGSPGWFQGFAVVAGEVGGIEVEVADCVCLLWMVSWEGHAGEGRQTLIPRSIPLGIPWRFPNTPVPQVGQNFVD
jgi:hypothetical protein